MKNNVIKREFRKCNRKMVVIDIEDSMYDIIYNICNNIFGKLKNTNPRNKVLLHAKQFIYFIIDKIYDILIIRRTKINNDILRIKNDLEKLNEVL